MGSKSYGVAASLSKDENQSKVLSTFAERLFDFVEVLNYVSEKSNLQQNSNVIKLYDHYLKTGSFAAKQKLTELGITIEKEPLKLPKA